MRLKLGIGILLLLLIAGLSLAVDVTEQEANKRIEDIVFNGQNDHSISLKEASHLTANYRDGAGENATLGAAFKGDIILNILSQENCKGIRYYYGLNPDGSRCLVLVGVDADGNDITEGILAEKGVSCPPFCVRDDNNPLQVKL